MAFAVCMKDPVLKPLDITVVYLDYLFLIDNVYLTKELRMWEFDKGAC